jgi:hypothetical protein
VGEADHVPAETAIAEVIAEGESEEDVESEAGVELEVEAAPDFADPDPDAAEPDPPAAA